jgi:hypothetical protein
MQRKIDVGEILGEAFTIYRAHAGVLLPVAFWLFLLARVVEELTVEMPALFWLGTVVSLTVGTLYQGMVVNLVSDIQDGRRDSSAGDLIRSVLPVFWRLIGAGFLIALGVAGGLLLLVVPGLYLMTIWAVAAPVIVLERRRVTDALGRSRQLVKGNGRPVFWTILAAFALSVGASLLLILAAEAVADGPLVRIVLAALAATVTAPIAALVAAVLYFRLLELRDAAAVSDSSASAAAESPPAAS